MHKRSSISAAKSAEQPVTEATEEIDTRSCQKYENRGRKSRDERRETEKLQTRQCAQDKETSKDIEPKQESTPADRVQLHGLKVNTYMRYLD